MMKATTVVILTLCAGGVAYLAGQRSHREPEVREVAEDFQSHVDRSRAKSPVVSRADAAATVRALGKYAACTKEFSAENAARLTSEERLDLLRMGASVGDFGNQAAMLCGLISILTLDEIRMAEEILMKMRLEGKPQAPEVWQTLWQQWGKLDAEGCFEHFQSEAEYKSEVDARNVMSGWLDTNAAAALSWAKESGKSRLQSAAAALAISRSVNGDLEKLEGLILAIPEVEGTVEYCLKDYFDLAILSGKDVNAAQVYDRLDPKLQAAAWTVTAESLSYGDTEAAKDWVMKHASDPGRNYQAIRHLMNTLAVENLEGAVKWVTQLPGATESDYSDPAKYYVRTWMRTDPEAAAAWLKTQPQDAPWMPDEGE